MKDDALPEFGNPIGPWLPWFAWYPVNTFDAGWRWLTWVGYRRCQLHDYITDPSPMRWWWQYRVSVPPLDK